MKIACNGKSTWVLHVNKTANVSNGNQTKPKTHTERDRMSTIDCRKSKICMLHNSDAFLDFAKNLHKDTQTKNYEKPFKIMPNRSWVFKQTKKKCCFRPFCLYVYFEVTDLLLLGIFHVYPKTRRVFIPFPREKIDILPFFKSLFFISNFFLTHSIVFLAQKKNRTNNWYFHG